MFCSTHLLFVTTCGLVWSSSVSHNMMLVHLNVPYYRALTSSGSRRRVRRGPRNMKSMKLPLAAIFFMTNFYRARGGARPTRPPQIYYCSFCLVYTVEDLSGCEGHPQGSKFFQFHAVLGKIWQNRMLASPWSVGAPTSRKSWIRHCNMC